MPDVTVIHNKDAHRYEVQISDEAAVLEYELQPGRVVMTHTEVPESFKGKGVGGALAKFALDDARDQGLQVVPRCPFVASYIRSHEEYLPLVPEEHRRLVTE